MRSIPGLKASRSLLGYDLPSKIMSKSCMAGKVGPWEGGAVVFAKFVDSFADGASFFSTNLLYLLLLSAFENHGQSVYLVFLFVPTIFLICFCLTFLTEAVPGWYYKRSGNYGEDKRKTVELMSDWWRGQWQWLMAFAVWTATVVTIQGFMRMGAWAFWVVDIGNGCLFLAVVALLAWVQSRKPRIKESLLESGDGEGMKRRLPAWCGWSRLDKRFWRVQRGRVMKLGIGTLNWSLGVGLYFTLKVQFPLYADALDGKPVDSDFLWGFALSGTTVMVFFATVLEVYQQKWKFNARLNNASMGKQRLQILGTDILSEEQLPLHSCCYPVVRSMRTEQRVRFWLAWYGNTYPMLKLSTSYVVGKLFLGVQNSYFGNVVLGNVYSAEAMTAYFSSLIPLGSVIAALFALAATLYRLKTQETHAENHGYFCVCHACAKEFYVNGHQDEESSKGDSEMLYRADAGSS